MKIRNYTVTLAVAAATALGTQVAQAYLLTGDRSSTTSSLERIQEPASVSDFDTYSFQEPLGVYDIGISVPGYEAAN
jgi:hypothetical protein